MLLGMQTLPVVTVVTPSFNQAQFLEETIQSVLGQEYPALEYWVMDGGSTDSSVEILRRYNGQLNWVSEKDKGQTDAINKGFERASGDILMYINSDDVMSPGVIWKVVKLFEEHPDAQWITGEYQIIDQDGKPREGFIAVYKRIQRAIMQLLPFAQGFFLGINNPVAQPSTWIRRSAWEEVGPFSVELRYTMDYEYWLRLLALSPVLIVSDVLSKFRVHSLSKGGTAYHTQMAEQLSVARAQGVAKPLLVLQGLHNQLILFVYQFIR